MNARILLEQAQRDYREPQRILSDLPGLCVSTPRALAELVSSYFRSNVLKQDLADREILKQISVRFHTKAGTLTEEVQQSIDLFVGESSPVLRIAHTPDHFAYLGVYLQFVFLNLVDRTLFQRESTRASQIFLAVDCDTVGDKRLRTSYFPDVDHQYGSFRLSVPVPRHSYNKVQFAIEKPSTAVVKEWVAQLERAVQHNLTALYHRGIPQKERGLIWPRLDVIRQEIWEAHARASSLAEFNTIFLSRIVNLYWKIPVAFWPLSQVAPAMIKCYEYLLQLYPALVELSNQVIDDLQSRGIAIKDNLRPRVDNFPFWCICPQCFDRVRLDCISLTPLTVRGTCNGCGSEYKWDVGTFSAPSLESVSDRLVPKVMFDTFTDLVAWKISGGLSYLGSAEHVLVNSLTASKLGWPVPPECLWRPRGIHYGLAEARAAQILAQKSDAATLGKVQHALRRTFFGRASILYFILSQGVDGLLEMWERHFEEGREMYDINIGQSPFQVPQDYVSALRAEIRSLDPLPQS